MENHVLYENYLNGSMTSAEKADFEKRQESDKDFAYGFKVYKELDEMLLLAIKREEFLKQLNEVEKETVKYTKPAKKILFGKSWLVAAASVLAFAILSVSLYFAFFSQPDYQKLYAENYAPLDISFATRSAEADTGILYNAITLYQMQRYNECINTLNLLKIPDDLLQVSNTFRGLSYLALDDLTNAELYLQLTVSDSLHIMYDDCLWYISLMYLKSGHAVECKAYLNILVKNESQYKKRAAELLDEI